MAKSRYRVPAKVYTLYWRILKNAMPTMDDLRRGGIEISQPQCPLCKKKRDTIDHLIWMGNFEMGEDTSSDAQK
ncbi:Reverse transcriptase zinc-binding domain [Dillenia turbinata]|uniref:Reverse transcriptase zinc-binding domain n=1 Tax=Dillenia turbinata TaxID=194707 RepID=A0AAN8Z1W9_9MAGN